MAIYRKSKNVSDQYMRSFVDNWKTGDSCTRLFKFLYLLIKDEAKKDGRVDKNRVEQYSQYAAKIAYDKIVSGGKIDYLHIPMDEREFNAFYQVCEYEEPLSSEIGVPTYSSYRVNSPLDIPAFLEKIPERNNSCEKDNIKLSVLLTLWNRLHGKEGVVLFHIDGSFRDYVDCLASILLTDISL